MKPFSQANPKRDWAKSKPGKGGNTFSKSNVIVSLCPSPVYCRTPRIDVGNIAFLPSLDNGNSASL